MVSKTKFLIKFTEGEMIYMRIFIKATIEKVLETHAAELDNEEVQRHLKNLRAILTKLEAKK